jgi:ZIP family zinc transporter
MGDKRKKQGKYLLGRIRPVCYRSPSSWGGKRCLSIDSFRSGSEAWRLREKTDKERITIRRFPLMQYSQLYLLAWAVLASFFLWLSTAAGASVAFFTTRINQKLLDFSMGFAGGLMFAISTWSLLQPALEISNEYGVWKWFPATAGFFLGVACLYYVDLLVPRLQLSAPDKPAKGLPSSLRRATLLTLAITVHNIPEGLAVGAIFGALAGTTGRVSLADAIALTIGLSLHKVVEGAAVALPLVREGMSSKQSFWYGQITAAVGPGAAIIGVLATSSAQPILPYAMGFAASAMIYVAVREIIPETQGSGNPQLAGVAFMVGYAVMMVLDIVLG